ncbi:MAG TPA: hypothetical protein VF898_05040 [Chloroflexota bacterium]
MTGSSNDEFGLAATQETLVDSLERLGRNLRRGHNSDPELAMEMALTAMATIRMWITAETLLAGAQQVGRVRLEEWEQELVDDIAHCSFLRQQLHAELRLSLRERNRRRQYLQPTGDNENGNSSSTLSRLLARAHDGSHAYTWKPSVVGAPEHPGAKSQDRKTSG